MRGGRRRRARRRVGVAPPAASPPLPAGVVETAPRPTAEVEAAAGIFSIPFEDFTRRKEHDYYRRAFDRPLRDLRAGA